MVTYARTTASPVADINTTPGHQTEERGATTNDRITTNPPLKTTTTVPDSVVPDQTEHSTTSSSTTGHQKEPSRRASSTTASSTTVGGVISTNPNPPPEMNTMDGTDFDNQNGNMMSAIPRQGFSEAIIYAALCNFIITCVLVIALYIIIIILYLRGVFSSTGKQMVP